jgi:hypothetical protein
LTNARRLPVACETSECSTSLPPWLARFNELLTDVDHRYQQEPYKNFELESDLDIVSYLLTFEPLTDQRAFEISRCIEPPESTVEASTAGRTEGSQASTPPATERPRSKSHHAAAAERDAARADLFQTMASKAYTEQVKKRKEASKVGISPPKDVASRMIPSGTRVLVRGLDTQPEYNDTHGRVLSFDDQKERYVVALDDGEELLLMAQNIECYSIVVPSMDADVSRPKGLSLASGAQRVNDVMQQVMREQTTTRSLLHPLSP